MRRNIASAKTSVSRGLTPAGRVVPANAATRRTIRAPDPIGLPTGGARISDPRRIDGGAPVFNIRIGYRGHHLMRVVGLGVAIGVAGMAAAWLAFVAWGTVGWLNFMVHRGSLQQRAEAAIVFAVKPGQRIYLEERNGRLVEEAYGRTSVVRTEDDHLFVVIDRGGGHLGSRGYVYSVSPGIDPTTVSGPPIAEEHTYTRVGDGWWCYRER